VRSGQGKGNQLGNTKPPANAIQRNASESQSKPETEDEKRQKTLKLAKQLAYALPKPLRAFQDLAFTDDMGGECPLTQDGPLTQHDASFEMSGAYGPAGSLEEDQEADDEWWEEPDAIVPAQLEEDPETDLDEWWKDDDVVVPSRFTTEPAQPDDPTVSEAEAVVPMEFKPEPAEAFVESSPGSTEPTNDSAAPAKEVLESAGTQGESDEPQPQAPVTWFLQPEEVGLEPDFARRREQEFSARQREEGQQREMDQQRQLEEQRELDEQRELEKQRKLEQQREIAQQRELDRQRDENDLWRKLDEQRELDEQHERDQQREMDEQRELDQQREIAQQREIDEHREVDQQRDFDEQSEDVSPSPPAPDATPTEDVVEPSAEQEEPSQAPESTPQAKPAQKSNAVPPSSTETANLQMDEQRNLDQQPENASLSPPAPDATPDDAVVEPSAKEEEPSPAPDATPQAKPAQKSNAVSPTPATVSVRVMPQFA
jgi:hypothetical protein